MSPGAAALGPPSGKGGMGEGRGVGQAGQKPGCAVLMS